MDGYSYLTFDQRREIEALYSDGERAVDIAAKIGRSVAAIYEELKRGYTGELEDVYKRQVQTVFSLMNTVSTFLAFEVFAHSFTPFCLSEKSTLLNSNPVSYTHLDVYKRQM